MTGDRKDWTFMRTFVKSLHAWVVCFLMLAAAGSSLEAAIAKQDPVKSARMLRSLGRLYMAYGQYDRAEQYIQTALEKAGNPAGDSSERAICLIDMATLYSYQDRLAEAEAMFARGLEAQRAAIGDRHPYVAHTLRNLSAVYRKQGELEKAGAVLDEAFAIMLDYHVPENRVLTPFYIDRAVLLSEQGNREEAEPIFVEMLERIVENFGRQHLYTAEVQKGLARLYLNAGDYGKAGEMLDSALAIQQKIYGPKHQLLIGSYLLMAQVWQGRHEEQQMQACFDKAVAAADGSNIIAVAKLYERIEQIRTAETVIAAAGQTLPEESAG